MALLHVLGYEENAADASFRQDSCPLHEQTEVLDRRRVPVYKVGPERVDRANVFGHVALVEKKRVEQYGVV